MSADPVALFTCVEWFWKLFHIYTFIHLKDVNAFDTQLSFQKSGLLVEMEWLSAAHIR